jgi:hypothetical protein
MTPVRVYRLFLEEIEEGLAMTVHYLRSSCAAANLFNKHLGLEERTDIINALIRHTRFDRLSALVARCWIKIQTVAAGMQIRPAIAAFIRNPDLIHYLNLRGAIITPRDKMKFCLDSSSRSPGTRRRFGLPFSLAIHISGLTIFSIPFPPYSFYGLQ